MTTRAILENVLPASEYPADNDPSITGARIGAVPAPAATTAATPRARQIFLGSVSRQIHHVFVSLRYYYLHSLRLFNVPSAIDNRSVGISSFVREPLNTFL